jgi:phosphate-selective porin OprO/OprP
MRGILATLLACFAATTSSGQSIEELKAQYEKEMQQMQKAFQNQLNALKTQQDAILEAIEDKKSAGEPTGDLEGRVAKLEEDKGKAENDFNMYWKEGIRFDSNNGAFKLKFGGRIQNDYSWWSMGDQLEAAGMYSDGGTEFRRARLYISGKIYDNYEFKAQYDFAGGDADFKDVWLAHNNVPVLGQIKVGHFKEPMGLEVLTSSKDTTFMERALPSVFTSERSTGIGMSRSFLGKRMGIAAGAFYEADGYGDAEEADGHNFTGRVHGRPYLSEDGSKYVHLGASASHRTFDDTLRIRQRPENHFTDRLVNTGTFAADDALVIGAEAAVVSGPFSAQGEYFHMDIDGGSGMSDADFSGYYVQGSWFLTGEHRRYKEGSGVFDKIKPKKNFNGFGKGGAGAWELAARFSNIDLNDGGITGGEEDNVTLGLNWYLNPNLKLMLNYVHGELDGTAYDDDFDSVSARFQVTW